MSELLVTDDSTAIEGNPGLYTVIDILLRVARQRPSKTAISESGVDITYSDLVEMAQRWATVLDRVGVKRGDRVVIVLPRSISAAAAFFGTHLVGGVVVLVNETLKPRQVDYVVEHSAAAVIVTNHKLRDLASGGCNGAKPPIVIDSDIDTTGVLACRVAPGAEVVERDLAALMYTSGSTGQPKGVMVTHRNLRAGAEIVADYLRLTEDDRTLSVLPWSFDYGLNQLLATLWAGGTVVIARSSSVPVICRTIREQQITGLAGVPPLWALLTRGRSPFLDIELPSLRYITNSGGVFPSAQSALIRRAHPNVSVFLMYGLTEAFRSTYLDPAQLDTRPDSMGKPIPNTEIYVVREDGTECDVDEVGELVHSGPTVAAGYWRDQDATDLVYRLHPRRAPGGYPEVVVYSGDYVRRDQEGFFYYVGRRDEIFKCRGMRVNPTEIETVLVGHPLIAQAVVFGATPPAGGEPVITAVITSDERLEQQTVLDFCVDELPTHMLPLRVIQLDDFPRSASGKIDRPALRREYGEIFQ